MASIARTAAAIAAILARDGIDYAQSKAVFRAARQRAGLRAPPERRGGVDRLTVEEELRFLDEAYAQDGRTGLMLQTLLETGARASELVQLRVEDIGLVECVVTIHQGKGGNCHDPALRRDDRRDAAASVRPADRSGRPRAGLQPPTAAGGPSGVAGRRPAGATPCRARQ